MGAPKSKLGRGFDSLIPEDLIASEFDTTAGQDQAMSVAKQLRIQDIRPSTDQPRRTFTEQAITDLASSIAEHGVLQPVIVVRDGTSTYMLVAGERRWRAAQKVGLTEIPALIRDLSDQQRLELAIIENIQREDLSPLELATALVKLEQQFSLSPKQVAQRVGKAPSTVSNVKRLLNLPDPAKRALASLRISEQHARAILSLSGEPQKQQELLDHILRYDWSAAKAEQFVKAYKEGATTLTDAVKRTRDRTVETEQIAAKLKTDVTLRRLAKGGRLIIHFKDDKDYARITKLLGEQGNPN